jgi:hypothetical protein
MLSFPQITIAKVYRWSLHAAILSLASTALRLRYQKILPGTGDRRVTSLLSSDGAIEIAFGNFPAAGDLCDTRLVS